MADNEEVVTEIEPTIYEEKARKSNWRPLDEWKGDPAEWVDAKEFVGRQPLYDRIKDLSHSITEQRKQFEQDFGQVSQHLANTEKRAYEKAIKELRAERRLAIEDKDSDAVEAIDTEIAKNQEDLRKAEQLAVQQRQQPGESPELKAWKRENPWFEEDKELQADAIEIGVGRSATNPKASQTDILEYVTKKIKKMHPDKFNEGVADVEDKPQSKVEGGNRVTQAASPAGKKGRLTKADLTEQQVSVMKTLIKRNVLADAAKKNNRTQEAEYLAQLESALTK